MLAKFITIVGALVAITSLAILATLSTSLLSNVSAAASSKTAINLVEPTIVGNIVLQSGEYRIEWNGPGPEVQVSFSQGNKIIAVVPATVQAVRNPVVLSLMYHTEQSGARSLVEIDTNHATLRFITDNPSDWN
jgi:hypothetical protein